MTDPVADPPRPPLRIAAAVLVVAGLMIFIAFALRSALAGEPFSRMGLAERLRFQSGYFATPALGLVPLIALVLMYLDRDDGSGDRRVVIASASAVAAALAFATAGGALLSLSGGGSDFRPASAGGERLAAFVAFLPGVLVSAAGVVLGRFLMAQAEPAPPEPMAPLAPEPVDLEP